MLRKLIKHEFRATARTMLPLYVVVLLTALGANVSSRVLLNADNNFLNLVGGLLTIAFVAAIMGVCIMSMVVMIQRFYKNLLGDEGYVMFTLPASVHQHVWSKIIVSSVWFILTGFVVVLAFFLMVYEVGFMRSFLAELRYLLENITGYYALNGTAIALEMAALTFLGFAAMSLQFYAAMATGHSFANHKGLLSVAFFFVYQFATQMLGGMLMMLLDNSWLHRFLLQFNFNLDMMSAIHVCMAICLVAVAIYGGIFYAVTTIVLQKKLNLE